MKKLLISVAFVISLLVVPVVGQTAHAAPIDRGGGGGGHPCETSFLGFTAWYRGIVDSKCNITKPSGSNGLQKFIWTIVLNIIDDMLRVVGLACVIFIIYGGFKYMTSTGSSDGMSKAKTTILNAIIGLVISVMSVAIVNLVVGSF